MLRTFKKSAFKKKRAEFRGSLRFNTLQKIIHPR
jgi:hypothetical protein